MSYEEESVGKTPPADRSSAKSRHSSGADRADPKEVLCSSTCRQTSAIALMAHSSKIINCMACWSCPETHSLTCSQSEESSDVECAPGPQPHTLIARPTVANHPAPMHLRLCTWKIVSWQAVSVSKSWCCRTACSLEVISNFDSDLTSRPSCYA